MHLYVPRFIESSVVRGLQHNPAVALLGPRQCGKSTSARQLLQQFQNAVYLDLEKPSDLNKLRDPEAFLQLHGGKLVCLDEIQRQPELFPVLRSLIDEQQSNGQYLILGSASPDLLRQTSESLAGRIAYLPFSPFTYGEVDDLHKLWLLGGFPRSYLAADNTASVDWRHHFIATFLERDIPSLGFRVPALNLRRFWVMCAHVSGQLLNASKLGASLGISHHTFRSYIDMFEQTFMLRVLPPLEVNTRKRLVKSPKMYLRDTGLLHALLNIETLDDLYAHPVFGASWESFAVETLLTQMPRWQAFFYRTAKGEEMDLILQKGRRHIAFEFKASTSPVVGKTFRKILDDLEIAEAWVIAPVTESYPIDEKTTVGSPLHCLQAIKKYARP